MPFKNLAVLLLASCAATTAQNSEQDLGQAMDVVNRARAGQNVQPLSWSADLAAYAQLWANEMASGREPFEHSSGAYRPGQGENLYEAESTQCSDIDQAPMTAAMEAWLAQGASYDGQPVATGEETWLHWCKCGATWALATSG